MFPQLPFSYFDNTDFCFSRLLSNNYAERDNGIYPRLLNRNYGSSSIAPPSLNDKILAYWKMDSATNLEWSTGEFADFIVNEVNPLSSGLALSNASSGIFVTGLISNALQTATTVFPSSGFGGNLDLINPFINGFNFIGFGQWVKTSVDTEIADTEFAYSKTIFTCNQFTLFVNVTTGNPVETVTESTVSLNFHGNTITTDSMTFVPLNEWVLILIGIDTIAQTANLLVNNSISVSDSYTTATTGLSFFNIGSDTLNDIRAEVDEVFVFSTPLTTEDRTTIYNSGIGNTYPFT